MNREFDSFLWHLVRNDGPATIEMMRALHAFVFADGVARAISAADDDGLYELLRAAQSATDKATSATISRDVRRQDASAMIDDIFAPLEDLASRLAQEPSGAGVAARVQLAARDLGQALKGERKFGSARIRWGVLAAFGGGSDAWLAEALGRSVERQLRLSFRAEVHLVTMKEDLKRCEGLVLIGPVSDDLRLAAGIAIGADIPVALFDKDRGAGLFDLPVFPDVGMAFQHVRRQALAGADPGLQEDFMEGGEIDRIGGAIGEARTLLLEQELRSLRAHVMRHLDDHACKIAELEKLAREHDLIKPFFDIVANGSRMGHSPTHAQLLNAARHRIDALQKRVDVLECEAEPPSPG